MDGRVVIALLTLVLPAVLMGVTAEYFHTNPLAVLGLFAVMIGGSLYLLSYAEAF